MIRTKDIQTTYKQTTSIECDKCKKMYDNIMDMQEFIHIGFTGGYGSVWGDGNTVEVDLCQNCGLEIFDKIARIKDE